MEKRSQFIFWMFSILAYKHKVLLFKNIHFFCNYKWHCLLVCDRNSVSGNYYVRNRAFTLHKSTGPCSFIGSFIRQFIFIHNTCSGPACASFPFKYALYLSFKHRYVNCNCSDFLGFIRFFYFRLVSKFYTYQIRNSKTWIPRR